MTKEPTVEVVSQDDAEALAEFYVCPRLTQPLMMPDNEIDLCTMCGEAIQFRPHAPKRLDKVCTECVDNEIAPSADDVHVLITPKVAKEVSAIMRKRRAH